MADDLPAKFSAAVARLKFRRAPRAAGAHLANAAPDPDEQKSTWKRRIIRTLLVLLLLLIAYLLFLWFFAQTNIHKADLLPNEGGNSPGENILLIGSDARSLDDLNNNGRSDVIQLIHIDSSRKRAYVIHFPRDLYVKMSCGTCVTAGGLQLAPSNGMFKINSAFSWGALLAKPGQTKSEAGSQTLVRTVENLLSTSTERFHIDHVAMIGFCGFTRLTDDLGGVDINVKQDYSEGVPADAPEGFVPAGATCEAGGVFGKWSTGIHHMNGIQALGFVRERHQLPNGDIGRGTEQQAWMAAVFRKLTHSGVLLNPVELPQLINDGLSNTIVDQTMGMGFFTSLARDVVINNLKITYYTAPWDPKGFVAIPLAACPKPGCEVVKYDATAMAQLGYSLRTDTMATYAYPPNSVE